MKLTLDSDELRDETWLELRAALNAGYSLASFLDEVVRIVEDHARWPEQAPDREAEGEE